MKPLTNSSHAGTAGHCCPVIVKPEISKVKRYTLHRFRVKNYTIRFIVAVAMLLSCLFFQRSAVAEYRCALVLSGGGARGFAQIGVLKALDSLHIKPDLIVATSMGAIVGGLYAAGFSADSIAALVRSIDWSTIYRNSSPRKSLFVLQKEELSNSLLEVRFNSNLAPVLPNAISHGQTFYDLLPPC